MKRIIYILIILSINSCMVQKKNKIMEQELIIPQITKEFEVFDIERFNKEVDNISHKRIVITEKKYLEQEDQSYGYISREYLNSSFFMVSKKFYTKGNIKQKGISFRNGSPIGVIYEFDEQGNLVKETNTDEGYDYGWIDVIKYCHRHEIELEKGYPTSGGIKTEIYKREREGEKVWEIRYYDAKKDEYLEVILDGKTGKELKSRKLEFIGG